MTYLFIQTLFLLLLALLLGLILGWLLRGVICGGCSRREDDDSTAVSSAASQAAVSAAPAAAEVTAAPASAPGVITADMKPVGLDGPNGKADDLKRISGVGPVIQKTLNGLGIYHFQQIADFTADNIAWVDDHIDFPGRIKREKWLSQSVALAEGKETEFAQRYDRGEVGDQNPNK